MSWQRNVVWFFMLFLCIAIGAYAFAYFFVDAMGGPEFKVKFALTPGPAWSHILGGGLCLTLGSIQFHPGIRNNFRNFHRLTGKIYLLCVLIGGIGGLLLAPTANGGPVSQVGFGMLAILWLYTGSNAYLSIRKKDIQAHQTWMIRNFALTFGAVTLRLHLPILQGGFGLSFVEAYPIVAWLAWVPNLIIAEWFIIPWLSTSPAKSLQLAEANTA